MKKIFGLFLLFFHFSFQGQINKSCAPILLLNGHSKGDTISIEDAAKLSYLTVYYPCDKKISHRIVSYIFSFSAGINNSTVFAEFGNSLTCKITDALKNVQNSNKISIDAVKVKNASGSLEDIPGLTLFIGRRSSIPFHMDDSVGVNTIVPPCHPVLLIGKYHDGDTVSTNELNLINQLSAYFSCNIKKKPNTCALEVYYKIISFNLKVIGSEYVFNNSSAEFPKSFKEQLGRIKKPILLSITEIKAKGYNGCILHIPDAVLTIVPVVKKGTDATFNKTNFTRVKKRPK